MIHRHLSILALSLVPVAAGADSPSSSSAVAADSRVITEAGDELWRVSSNGFKARALPYGPDRTLTREWDKEISELAIVPGYPWRMLVTSPPLGQLSLQTFQSGSIVKLADIPKEINVLEEYPLDLKAAFDGRLYALTDVLRLNHSQRESRLIELDPVDGTFLRSQVLAKRVTAIAPSPDGFWAVSEGFLRTLDPITYKISGPSLPLGGLVPYDIDVDSSGGVWIWEEGVCSPPCSSFFRLDPTTGAISEGLGPSNQFVPMQDIVIERRCQASAEAACLQGGRFRATLTYSDPSGNTGNAKVATGRSADTALFYFFEPNNWEVMVKVLNGCVLNSHFWVYGSASTDVAFTLTVQDLETGAERKYSNPLGQLANGITEGFAFVCPQ